MITILSIASQIVLLIALADLLAGAVHWAEDAYGTEHTPVLGPLVIRPNIVHHHFPRFFTKLTWWQSSWELLLVGVGVIVAAAATGHLGWQVVLFGFVSVNANQVHKWSHRTRAENGRIISALQDWYILQTPRQHGLHHSDPKNTYYCPITNFVNPILERVRFWAALEAIIEAITGVAHREDTAVRGQGPGPAWLAEFRPSRPHAAAAAAVAASQNLGARLPLASAQPIMANVASVRATAAADARCARCQQCSGMCRKIMQVDFSTPPALKAA